MSVQEQIDQLLTQRAAQWFEVYRTGQEEQYPAFVAWLTESPRHLQELLEIAGRYAAVRDALRAGAFDHEVLLQKLAPQVRRLPPPAHASAQSSRRSIRRWTVGLAASLLLAVGAFGVWRSFFAQWQSFETQVGEQQVVQLLDGSVLTLNAESAAAVRLTSSRRDIKLMHGEALFKVAPDKLRPFLVRTRGATIRAIGTQFNVRARPDGTTTVAVLEGRVEVSGPAATQEAAPRVSLGSGEVARVASSGMVRREAHANVNSALAWRQRRLVFDRAPLEDMVAEFNRYNRTLKLRMTNVTPGSYHFTGSFDADDPRSLALLLAKEPKLLVQERDGQIVIRDSGS